MEKFIFKSEILGQLAHWAVRLSSYVPDYIPQMIRAADKYISENQPGEIVIENMFKYQDDLHEYIKKMCHTVPEIKMLNFRKEEIEAGLTDPEADRPHIPYDKNSSFVDLGALSRNISNSIEREYKENV